MLRSGRDEAREARRESWVAVDARPVPRTPPGIARRTRLLERLTREQRPPVVVIVAPAGYGKTTLLRQWAADLPDSVAELALEPADNDPQRFLSHLMGAITQSEPVDPVTLALLATPGHSLVATVLPRIVDSLWIRQTPTQIVLDDFHVLTQHEVLDAVRWLAHRLPTSVGLSIASRTAPDIGLAELRALGHVLELDASDLSIDATAARHIARTLGLAIDRRSIDVILDTTQGWPAATHLALLARRSPSSDVTVTGSMSGSFDELVRMELVRQLDEATQWFLVRAAVLDPVSGPLCDAVLDTTGSQEALRALAAGHSFLRPHESVPDAYRYHELWRGVLLQELERREPAAAASIAARASAWCASHGDIERAIGYARATGDMDLVEPLVVASAFPFHWTGRTTTVHRWLRWFDADGQQHRRSLVAILAAWSSAMEGDPRAARRWLGIAEGSEDPRPMPDGADRRAWIACLRAFMIPPGPATLTEDARLALAGVPEAGPMRQSAWMAAMYERYAAGDLEAADACAATAVAAAEERGAAPGIAQSLGMRSLIALRLGDPVSARRYVERGMLTVDGAGLQDHVASGMLHAANASTALAAGSPDTARRAITRVHGVRPRLTSALTFPAALTRLEAARACLELHEPGSARMLLQEVRQLLRDRPALVQVRSELTGLERRIGQARWEMPDPWSLTSAELRLVTYLPTQLSFREVAQRLGVSPNTVKTQAIAAYAKLGAASRREAVERAVDAGFIDPAVRRIPGLAGPDLPFLPQTQARTRDATAGLTLAEERVLGYLPSRLSMPQIADQLYVSPHTVKTQVLSVYRKLGVSSRRAAIQRGLELGLLDRDAVYLPDDLGSSR